MSDKEKSHKLGTITNRNLTEEQFESKLFFAKVFVTTDIAKRKMSPNMKPYLLNAGG